jgi:hypothetical protein
MVLTARWVVPVPDGRRSGQSARTDGQPRFLHPLTFCLPLSRKEPRDGSDHHRHGDHLQ